MKNNNPEFNFFSSRTIGRTLKEVAIDLIQTEHDDVISRWFHSQSETDLYTWVDKRKNILKQQLSFYGQIVEWNCVEGLKTGVIIESDLEVAMGENTAPVSRQQTGKGAQAEAKPSETIQFDQKPQPRTIALAIDILRNMEDADPHFKLQLVTNFEAPQNMHSMPSEAFIEKFGLNLKNYQTADHGFWASMKTRIRSLFHK